MPDPTDPRHPAEPPPPEGSQPPPADDLDYRHSTGRLHFAARQRGLDATALGQLVLYLPGTVMSLVVLLLISGGLDAWLGVPFWILPLVWLLSGALLFHRPVEDFLALHLLRLQRPLPDEYARLAPIWREVTARAGVDGRTYELWVQDSDDLNAYAAAGHIVGVTRFALDNLSSAQLAAILAHELGHHTGGHVWSSLLGEWYALPGRLAWRVIRSVMVLAVAWASYYSWLATALLIFVTGLLTISTLEKLYGLPLILLVTPYLIAAVGRRAELRADQHAAGLGFARELAGVLQAMHEAERKARLAAMTAAGGKDPQPGLLARLLATHPDYPTRLHRLRPYL
ncbi:Zn-dependent protease with chaperone function [Streptomyces sp. cf386]|uniref:M48 family metalloprotease n=1 Tax=Streptomyces sp. cf386 TaxID=1761904 RepID=UPI00087F936A|nr:M48 family metalloprotease [Streptomyces sp. cf386]SDN06643.1 Zn-dependent protease with chaperone function [Streptomyces sp. cf386]